MNRHQNAIYISDGACNVSGIAYSLIEACQEARQQKGYINTDPAIQLMVSQLAYLTGIWDGVSNWRKSDFGQAREACRQALINGSQEALSI